VPYLDGILEWHRARAAEDRRDVDLLVELARRRSEADPPRPFAAALRSEAGPSVIAEIKRRSPSKGDLAPDLDPASLASAYERGGAACLSVLTDSPHFGGGPEDLAAARSASRLPLLRKDFTVCAADVCDARLMGADAVLLIVAALGVDELSRFLQLASDLGLAGLVEVHDEEEASRAVDAGADLIGVNQRDLHTFEVDPGRAARLAGMLPPGVLSVAESGIASSDDVRRLGEAGFDAVLVGEVLVRSQDPAQAVRGLLADLKSPAGAGGAAL
jgi:indole-3-glycerol phosphate synthase